MTPSKTDEQYAQELQTFRRFAATAQLAISPDSIQKRQPPEPDIQCVLAGHGDTCFELVEILDPKLARKRSNQRTFQESLPAAAVGHLPELKDALVFVTFTSETTNAQRTALLPRLMALLRDLPVGFRGVVPVQQDPALGRVLRRISITRPGVEGGPLFQVAGAAFVSDPIVECIESKFRKRYETANRLSS